MLFPQRLSGYGLKLVKSAASKVSRRKYLVVLHRGHEPRRPQLRKLHPCQWMPPECLDPLFEYLLCLLLIVKNHPPASASSNSLQVLRPHYRPNPRPPGNSLLAHNRCIKHEVFASRAYHHLPCVLRKSLLSFPCRLSPKLSGVVENDLAIVYLYPDRFRRFTSNYYAVEPSLLQVEPEIPAAVGRCQKVCERRQCGDVEPAGAGRP